MPSHTTSSAMIQLFHDGAGAPWMWPTWMEITGVHHGLFSDNPSEVPHPWTTKDAQDVSSYFSQYKAILNEVDKIKFAAGVKNSAELPGRIIWRSWVVKQWARCRIHDLIKDTLSSRGVHPIQLMVADNNLDVWPSGPSYIPLIIDDVCLVLFGPEALNSTGMVPFNIRAALGALIQCTWCHIRKTVNREKKMFHSLTTDVENLFKEINRDQPSRVKIRNLIRAVSKWKTLAQLFGTPDVLMRIETIENDLEGLMGVLGANVRASASREGISKQTVKLLQALASEQNVQDLIAFYRDCFSTDDSVNEYEPLVTGSPIGIQFAESADGGGDPGVETESLLDVCFMKQRLGLRMGVPALFNCYRHKSGLPLWSQDSSAILSDPSASTNSDLEPLELHYHQVSGIHACIRHIFSDVPSTCTGVLLADDVGLGKTFQALSVVALMAIASFAQLQGHTLSPLINDRKYLGNSTHIPNMSHLIVVPGTLMSQWEAEARTVFRYGSVDILLYRGGKARADFWGSEGLYAQSKHSPCHIIIIASSSAVQNDFNDFFVFSKSRKSAGTPWDTPPRRPGLTDARIKSNLFGHRYLTVVRDEAQDCRNVGAKHTAMLALLELAPARLVLTATPLQTSTKDIAAMGRLVGIPHFLSEESLAEEKEDTANLRYAKGSDSNSEAAVKQAQVLIASRMQIQFEGRVIRRTLQSKNQAGLSLVDIPPLNPVVLVMDLTHREMETITALSQKVSDSVSNNNGVKKLGTKGFYLEYRMAVGFVMCSGEIPVFDNLLDWEAVKSTKIDFCSMICKHLLVSDDAPMVFTENGQVVFPPIPDNQNRSTNRRILIYQEFTSLMGLLQNILSLHGVESAAINGDTTFQQRADVVRRFTEGDGPRVLIISAVGGVGLNLSCADTVIFLDQPWSSQDVRQIRGRIHRQPQKSVVNSIHLLASGTADILLSEMAEGKKGMLDAFLSKDNELRVLLDGRSAPTEDSDDDGDEQIIAPIRSRKRARKAGATAAKGKMDDLPTAIKEDGNVYTPAEPVQIVAESLLVVHNMPANNESDEVLSSGGSMESPAELLPVVHTETDHNMPANDESDEVPSSGGSMDLRNQIGQSVDDEIGEKSPACPESENDVHVLDVEVNGRDGGVYLPANEPENKLAPSPFPQEVNTPLTALNSVNNGMADHEVLVTAHITTSSALAEIRARRQNSATNNSMPLPTGPVLQTGSKSNIPKPQVLLASKSVPIHRQPVDHPPLSPPPATRRLNTNPIKRRR